MVIDLGLAVLLDWILGDPYWFPHPIKLMGHLITFEQQWIRKYVKTDKQLKYGGLLMVVVNIMIVFGSVYTLLRVLTPYPVAYRIVNVYLLYTCLAARCLHHEAKKVYHALKENIDKARYALSFIVGRETAQLQEDEIVKATVETVAENTSDGLIAPLLYAMIGGAPLALMYKMINTMDSMVGYVTAEYKDIGFFPAKIDDVFNFIPARLTGLLMNVSALFGFDILGGFKIMWRDRKNHKSPNCAYPEGAVAGLMGIQLGGSHRYFGEIIQKPTIGEDTRKIIPQDITKVIEIMYRSEVMLMIFYIGLELIL